MADFLKAFALNLQKQNNTLTQLAGGMLGLPPTPPVTQVPGQPLPVGTQRPPMPDQNQVPPQAQGRPAPFMPQGGNVPNPPQANMVTQPVPATPLPQGQQPVDQYDIATARPIDTGPIPAPQGAPGVIFDVLVNEGGVDAKTAYATLGNLQQESGFNPASWNDEEGAFGIAQWRGPRFEHLKRWAKETGQDYTDLRTQARFILQEGKTTHKDAWDKVLNAPDVGTASDMFDQHYEISAGTERENRRQYANAFAAGDPMGLNEAWVSTSGYDPATGDPTVVPAGREHGRGQDFIPQEEQLGWRDRLLGRAPADADDDSAAAGVRRTRKAQLSALGVGLGQISHGQPVDVSQVLESHYRRTQEISERAKEIRMKQQAERERNATIAAMPEQYQQIAVTSDEGFALATDLWKQDRKEGGADSNAPLPVDPAILEDMNNTDPRTARMYASGNRAAQDIALSSYETLIGKSHDAEGEGAPLTPEQLQGIADALPPELAYLAPGILSGDDKAREEAYAGARAMGVDLHKEVLGRETSTITAARDTEAARAERENIAIALRGSGDPELAAQADLAVHNDTIAQQAYAELMRRTGGKYDNAEAAADFTRQRDAFVNLVSANDDTKSLGVGITSPEMLEKAMGEYFSRTGKEFDAKQAGRVAKAETDLMREAIDRGVEALKNTGNGDLIPQGYTPAPTQAGLDYVNNLLTKSGESKIEISTKDALAKAESERNRDHFDASWGDKIPGIGDIAATSPAIAEQVVKDYQETEQKKANLDELITATTTATDEKTIQIREAAKLVRASPGALTMAEAMERLYPEAPTSVQELEAYDTWDAAKQQRWLTMQKSQATGGNFDDQIALRKWDSADNRIQRVRKSMEEEEKSATALRNMQDLLDQTNWELPTGSVQSMKYPYVAFLDSIGLITGDASQTISQQTALNQFKKAALGTVREPGATSEGELKTYMHGLPGLESSPLANKLTLQAGIANRELQEHRVVAMEDYLATNRNLDGFDKFYKEQVEAGLVPDGTIDPMEDTPQVMLNRINSGYLKEGMVMKFLDENDRPYLKAVTATDIEALRQVSNDALYGGQE